MSTPNKFKEFIKKLKGSVKDYDLYALRLYEAFYKYEQSKKKST